MDTKGFAYRLRDESKICALEEAIKFLERVNGSELHSCLFVVKIDYQERDHTCLWAELLHKSASFKGGRAGNGF